MTKQIYIISLVALFLFYGATTWADWEKTFIGNGLAGGASVQETNDGGFIIAGVTLSSIEDNPDIYLLKTDSLGNEIWSKIFGGNDADYASSVRQTDDGGYIITGATQNPGHVDLDAYLIKTDSFGNEQWSKTFGGNGNDYSFSVRPTDDGGYIIAGRSQKIPAASYLTDAFLIKTDSSGNEIWSKTLDIHEWDQLSCVEQTTEGGYIAVGEANDGGPGFIYAIKTDSFGNEIWSKKFSPGWHDVGQTVQQTNDKGFIIGATSGKAARMIKTDYWGNEEWSKNFEIDGSYSTMCYYVIQTKDNGYAITGIFAKTFDDISNCYNNREGDIDIYVIKTDSSGAEEWQKIFDTDTCNDVSTIQQTTNNNYILTGTKDNTALLIYTSGGSLNVANGDIDDSGTVTLEDAILALKVLSGAKFTVHSDADINSNKKIDLAEAVYILQKVSILK